MTPYAIQTDAIGLTQLEPGDAIRGSAVLFWGSNGFAFDEPGRYGIEAGVVWNPGGAPLCASNSTDVWVDFPTDQVDNQIADLLLTPQVGIMVALGGWCDHLYEGVECIQRAFKVAEEHPACTTLEGILKTAEPLRPTLE